MGNEKFSRRGQPPTEYELRLLQNAASDSVWLDIARKLMAEHGVEAGARALLTLLDDLGTEKVHVPCREMLFRSLHRPERDRRALELLEKGEQSVSEIAAQAGLSKSGLRYVAQRSGRRSQKKRVRGRA